MTDASKEEVSRQVTASVENLGREAARTIMARVHHSMIDPDEMEEMVHTACADFEECMRLGDICDHDREVMGHVYRAALIREGGRIARALEWEGGTA